MEKPGRTEGGVIHLLYTAIYKKNSGGSNIIYCCANNKTLIN